MKTYLWKFNKESEQKPMQGDKWILTDLETLENTYTDYISIKAALRTEAGDLGLGHGMVVTGNIIHKEHPKIGKYIELSDDSENDFVANNKQLIGIKLDIPNLSGAHDPKNKQRVPNMAWRIYGDIKSLKPYENHYFGPDIQYVYGIDIEDVTSWTGNMKFHIGWSLLVEGEVKYFEDEETGLRFAKIFKGNV